MVFASSPGRDFWLSSVGRARFLAELCRVREERHREGDQRELHGVVAEVFLRNQGVTVASTPTRE